jgi:hypothetical protein
MTSKDLDEAIEVASHIPCARTGTIEVRPIWGRSAPVSEYWCRSQNRPQQTSNPRVSSRPPTPSDRNRIETVDRIKQKDRSGHRRYSRRESTPPRRLRELESSRDDKHTTRNRRSCTFPSGTNPTGARTCVLNDPKQDLIMLVVLSIGSGPNCKTLSYSFLGSARIILTRIPRQGGTDGSGW